MRRRWISLIIAVCACAFPASRADAGLIINLFDNGGTAPTTTGTGTLYSIMRAASDVWELAYNGSGFNHTLDLYYGWGAQSSTTLASHSLFSQGGTPNRETLGLITFDNDGSSAFFLDGTLDVTNLSTLITSSSEYTSGIVTSTSNLGGGAVNVQRTFSGATGAASGRFDAFSIALHEIGHALGIASGNLSYQAESWPDNDIDITGSMPFVGTVIPTTNTATPTTNTSTSNAHINISTTLFYPSFSAGTRKLPSAVDILANAQLSQFSSPNYDLSNGTTSAPEPSGLLLASIVGGCGLAFGRRRRCITNTTPTKV